MQSESFLSSDLGFGTDRTNAGSAPRPSKRTPAGRGSSTPMNLSAPAYVPMSQHDSWNPTSVSQPPFTAYTSAPAPSQTRPMSQPQSPVAPNAEAPQQMEDFKSMVLQMANFFTKYPEANIVPPGFTTLFQQLQQNPSMSVGALQPARFHDPAVVAMEHQMPSVTIGNDAYCAPPKPNRRAFAIPTDAPLEQHHQPQYTQSQYQHVPSSNPHANSRGGRGGAGRSGAGSAGPRSRGAQNGYVSTLPDTEPKIVVLVEFKRQRMKKYESEIFVAPGNYVIVEGDRGLDCGFVIHSCVREPDGSFSRQESIDSVQIDVNRIKSESGRVVRLAREDDVKTLHSEIASSELTALQECREMAARMNLNMEIVDCEYQFDRKKISFYFEAPHSVDFRELNTELFRRFGVRIWLENLNSKVKNVVPDGALSHSDKLQYTKNGLRPPRRI